ncbi:uncharacterized protein LOC134539909 [Bacillus rossius redtenbacheri]|uniref:uncharacterized protein LOC134539909 n=1 Tax=Bacillus rossius redtenbacheri TaxID=93214 RepID=UPI002FDE0B20
MQSHVGVSWGLVRDVIDLKQRYDVLGASHESFIQAWHDEKMPYIICGLQSLAETLEFTEETYHVASAYLSPPATYKERVFGMYLLDAFYNCQHLKGEVKVLVTLSEWNDLLELQKSFQENGDDKAAFLFCLMRINNAFVASAATRAYGLEKNFRKYFNSLKDYYRYSSYNYTHSQELLESSVISELDQLRCESKALREKLANPCSSVFSQDLPDVKLALQEVIYKTKISEVCARYSIREAVEESSGDEEQAVEIGSRRRHIKDRSFAALQESPRHRRGGQESGPDGHGSDEDYCPGKASPQSKRPAGRRGRPRKLAK